MRRDEHRLSKAYSLCLFTNNFTSVFGAHAADVTPKGQNQTT